MAEDGFNYSIFLLTLRLILKNNKLFISNQ